MEDGPADAAESHRGRSPWERDDWLPEPFVADFPAAPGPPVEPETSADPAPTGAAPTSAAPPTTTRPEHRSESHSTDARTATRSTPPVTRIALAVGALAIVATAAVVLLRDDATREGAPSNGTVAGGGTLDENATESAADLGPMPIVLSGSTTSTIRPETDPPDTRVFSGAPAIGQVVDGETPDWTETTIGVPEPLASMQVPTEVATIDTDGIVRRTEFPSGRTRSIGVAGLGPSPFVVAGSQATVVFAGPRLALVPDDGPVRLFEFADGVAVVQERPGDGSFLVTTAAPSAGVVDLEYAIAADGTIDAVEGDPVLDVPLPERNFLPTGELVVNRPGGTYAVATDGVAARLTDGDLLAVGQNHYAVAECDAALVCSQTVVDVGTGERAVGRLGEVVERSRVNRSTRLSPDGAWIVYRDDTRSTGIRRIVSVETGTGVDVGRAEGFQFGDPWAADSSGIFLERDGALLFQARESAQVTVVDLVGTVGATITDVAVRPAD